MVRHTALLNVLQLCLAEEGHPGRASTLAFDCNVSKDRYERPYVSWIALPTCRRRNEMLGVLQWSGTNKLILAGTEANSVPLSSIPCGEILSFVHGMCRAGSL